MKAEDLKNGDKISYFGHILNVSIWKHMQIRGVTCYCLDLVDSSNGLNRIEYLNYTVFCAEKFNEFPPIKYGRLIKPKAKIVG